MKVCFHTSDIFAMKPIKERKKYFDLCHKEALKRSLICKCIIENKAWTLELWGTKCQFLKYYWKTLIWHHEDGWSGVKRFISFSLAKN